MTMLKKAVKYIFVACLVISYCDGAPVNDTDYVMLPLCHRDNPELGDCIKNATEMLRDQIKNGIPELKLPSLEPLKIPTIKLEQHNSDLEFKAILTDVEVHGLSNYKFTDVNVDMDNLSISAMITFDHIYLDSDYMLMGKYQMLPVEGSGRLMVNFTDTMIDVFVHGMLVKRKDDYFFMSQNTEVTVDVGSSDARFENLFSGEGEKGQISDHLVKMHSEEIMEKLKPTIETVLSMVFDDVTDKFYKTIPFDKLFPA